jgi:hypothetical protein
MHAELLCFCLEKRICALFGSDDLILLGRDLAVLTVPALSSFQSLGIAPLERLVCAHEQCSTLSAGGASPCVCRRRSWLSRLYVEDCGVGFQKFQWSSPSSPAPAGVPPSYRFTVPSSSNANLHIKLDGMGPKLLVSDLSTADQPLLRWRLVVRGNTAVEFGVVPLSMVVRVRGLLNFCADHVGHTHETAAVPQQLYQCSAQQMQQLACCATPCASDRTWYNTLYNNGNALHALSLYVTLGASFDIHLVQNSIMVPHREICQVTSNSQASCVHSALDVWAACFEITGLDNHAIAMQL